MDKQIQFSINRNALFLVSIIIGLLLLALCCGRGGRGGYDMKMMRGRDMMMQKKMRAVEVEDQRLMQPPTQEQLDATSTMLQ